ncbi:kinase D-interacting substrate of 220 kDa B isoform X1 [Cyprinodon tularosa]|uniref:kinase D-interacting substrate of 220 kDa B isoform X1 n=1 Tax=Cyprinodon tularosa TaxID=77115 RepID=UPI0018E21195|nr:kinase D-interacting substrate of 220 kDa B isoform X1 [Cyprinodon tularosa]XP_038162912.1 kinase D-interacting substrate of 220 kDa B isoform X1 [Cyprinodon tularosa]XP_038162913.1 kinase D-interacting substrate of 220 kDa B isoform X1 [Cyprinodon tularosa]XP_038162914.1 kinase D-interacting substrate of 220 kDa B isoform X1 [Cyprinodon tularosa]
MDTTASLKMTSLAVQSLFSYVEEENLAAVRAHLDKFRDVDCRSDNGQTPLMVAAELGNLEIVQELIRRGATVNMDDVDCWTALISAAKEGHFEVVRELLENNANLEHRDMGGWTALMWAAYKGRTEVAQLLLEKGANPNITGQYSVYPIIWAAGRGHAEIVHLLLQHGAKVNCSDKYGTTPLIWAARKNHYDSVMHLLENGADVDQEGANSMTALIVAVKGGHTDVVKELLKRNPNVNMTDKDGNTALAIAAKEGHTEIVQDLLDAGTYVNIPDRSGETVLIGAVRGGHVEIVRALLNKYADVDVRGQDGKTALYWAVEKGNAAMVRDILQCNPDTESCTKEGETPLIKATKMRNIEIVELLLDKGAKVSEVDRKGDTALHIAIRGRSRKLAELLLRNPKDGRLLYRPNKAGETPYNIDCTHQKSILTQIFGAKHLSPTESDGDMLGYDLYSSALADILSEPTMQPPICVGLYAQWGSGKSFLLKKLEDEMKTFAGQQIEPLFQFSWLVVLLALLLCGSVAIVLGFTVDPKLAIAVSLSLLALLYIFFVLVYFGSRRERESWRWAWVISTRLARQIGYMELLLKLMFVNPLELPEQTTRALPVRFLFTDYNRLSSVGGETSLAEMIATLSDACEREFGFLATRLFRVFMNDEIKGQKWKKTCCLPSFVVFSLTLICLISGVVLLAIFKVDPENRTVNAVLIAMASVVGLALLLNFRTWWQVADSVLNSQRKRLHGAANNLHKLKSEGFMKVLKHEVEMMSKMAKTIDGFTQNQTRMAVIIDGLDACEQDKVLQMLDTVRVLFSKGPFISIFASDPHIIIKAINQNLNSVLRDSNINGHDYMRNIVHLPVFLNSRGLSRAKKLCLATPTNGEAMPAEGWHEDMDRKVSQNSLSQEQAKLGSRNALNRRDTYRRRQMQRTLTRQMSFDLTKLLVTEDWFCDISPQTMRRLLNIVSITGRLLRANQILFNWDRLASWIHLTEEWPYRTSWIILFLEEAEGVSDQITLKTVYERISKNIPTTKDVEPLLEIDGDIRSFEVFLSSRTPVLVARDVEMFLPCTVNLDPKLREIIADVRAARDQMHLGGVTYPTLSLQEAAPRPQSGYGQLSAACSPSGSFAGSLPLQPHSSYFSGMTGPQHPFYNRPYFPHHVYHLPRHYPHHVPPSSRPSIKQPSPPQDTSGLDVIAEDAREGLPSSPCDPAMMCPAVPLSSLGTDGVCERLKQIDGMDPNMLSHYAATIAKANINGRVLTHCNLDELKKEMEMNFGDWQLFRGMVMEQRHAETQAALQEECRAASEQGSIVLQGEPSRRPAGPQRETGAFSLNLSFEELSGAGLEEPPRRSTNSQWTVTNHHTSSMSSLNSQESSNDICKLTDKQQAEYRDAYREYIAQMAQLEMSGGGGERPVQPHPGQFLQAAGAEDKGAKEGAEPDGRKPFNKRASKSGELTDFASGADAQLLDPISEEDEKLDHSLTSRTPGSKKKGAGSFYHQLPSEEEWGPEEADTTTPLLHKEGRAAPPPQLAAKPGLLTDILLDKKDSSDSGMRSSDSSPDASLEEADGGQGLPKPSLIELELEGLVKKRGLLPSRLSGLQDAAVARMSICSDAPSEASLMASSPDEGWPSDAVGNLNRSASSTTLNNNSGAADDTNSNNSRQRQEAPLDSGVLIIHPGSTTSAAAHQNQNLRSISLGDERESVL